MSPSIVALIPARAGSQRVPRKNMRLLGGKPLIQWTIDAARESGIFSCIAVCTDDESYQMPSNVVPIWRTPVPDDQPDIVWVREALERISPKDCFAILRPTSPFRTAETIRRAWREFQEKQPIDSIRAIEPVRQHPCKMWEVSSPREMHPIFPRGLMDRHHGPQLHSRPTQTLPCVYVQNASLEIAWTRVVAQGSISGDHIAPFFTQGLEGVDINTEEDFARAEAIAATLHATTT